MNLLFLCHNHPEYGTFFRAFQLAKQLVRGGHRVVMMLISGGEKYRVRRYDREGVWIIECPHFQPFISDKEDGWGPPDILFRCIYGLTHRIDVVVAFGHKPDIAIPALLLKYLKGATLIADWCDLWGEGGIFTHRGLLAPRWWWSLPDRILVRLETFLERFIVRRADGVTVICTMLEGMARERGAAADRVLLLRSGCDGEGIKPMEKGAARRDLGLPDGPVIEYMGNYLQESGLLARAFERISSIRDDVRLLIVGPRLPDVPEGEAARLPEGQRRLRELSSRAGGRIAWTGQKSYAELPACLAAADILLLPMEDTALERGRWPNKVSDYLAAGRSIAATDVGDAGAFIRERGCGIVTPPDGEAFSRAVLDALGDPGLLDRLGANSRRVAEGELSWESVAARFTGFVRGVRGRARRPWCGRTVSRLLLAAYTLAVIVVEGAYLLAAYAAMRCGWGPGEKNGQ